MSSPLLFLIILAIHLFLAAGLIWLFLNHGLDKLKHPEEWKDAGISGERIVYNTLISKYHIPERQILRNVYVPIQDKTAEIDLLIVSKKGIIIFECKNYGGRMYGDAKQKNWTQRIGRQVNHFYNPIFQNRNHAKYLEKFLSDHGISAPIIPVVATIMRGKWKVKNLEKTDYFLGVNYRFGDVYRSLPKSKDAVASFSALIGLLAPLSRPADANIKENHIKSVSSIKYRRHKKIPND